MKRKARNDIEFLLVNRHNFNFDGASNYLKKGKEIVNYNKKGVNGLEAFYLYDSQGQIKETKHPNIMKALLKTKGSLNLHIKMWAEDRAKGVLPKICFEDIIKEFKLPNWVVKAVEKQKKKYYE